MLQCRCFRSSLLSQAEIQALTKSKSVQRKREPSLKRGTSNSLSPKLYAVSNSQQDTRINLKIM